MKVVSFEFAFIAGLNKTQAMEVIVEDMGLF